MSIIAKRARGYIYYFIFLSILALTGFGCENERTQSSQISDGVLYEVVEIKGKSFNLELALTPEDRSTGLMGRDNIPDDGGMLFVFPDDDHYPREVSFWMKDCLVTIDVIFIRKDGFITAIHSMDPPHSGTPDSRLLSYGSNGAVQYAIELKGGRADELGLQVGDQIALRGRYLLQMAE